MSEYKCYNIFLSSTFDKTSIKRRDYFRTVVSSEINYIFGFLQGNVYLRDYEWGIPNSIRNVRILERCIDSIYNDTQHFIGIIGNRYGTIVSEYLKENNDDNDILKYNNEITEAVANDWSIFELEIRVAIKSKLVEKVFFVDKKSIESADDYEKIRLTNLIKLIKENNFKVIEFVDSSEFDNVVLEYFKDYFNRKYNLNSLNIQQKEINSKYSNKLRYYVNCDENTASIDNYIKSDDAKCMVITGKSGAGKSTFLLHWVLNRKNKEFTLLHIFVGTSYQTLNTVFSQLIKQLNKELKINSEKDSIKGTPDSNSVVDNFFEIINELEKTTKLVVVIDGVDQIISTQFLNITGLLERQLPNNVKLIFSTNQTLALNRNFVFHKIISPNADAVIQVILRREGKYLEYNNIINSFSDIKEKDLLPIAPIILVRHLMLVAKYDNFNKIIAEYHPYFVSIEEMYKIYFKTISNMLNIDIIKHINTYIYVSRSGLSKYLIKKLMSYYNSEEIDRIISVFNFEYNRDIDNKLTFQNSIIKNTLYNLFICNKSNEINARISIAKELWNKKDKDNILELTFQLYKIISYSEVDNLLHYMEKLKHILSVIDNVMNIFDNDEFAINKYLAVIKDNNFTVTWNDKIKKKFLDNNNSFTKYSKRYPLMLLNLAKYKEVIKWYNYYETSYKNTFNDINDIVLYYKNIAEAYLYTDDITKTDSYLHKAIDLEGVDNNYLLPVYNLLGFVNKEKGLYKTSIEYYNKYLDIIFKKSGINTPKVALIYNNIARVYSTTAQHEKSLEYNIKALTIRKEMLGDNHPDTTMSLNNIAVDYLNMGETEKALDYMVESYNTRKIVLGEYHPYTIMNVNNLGAINYKLHRYDSALMYFKEAKKLNEAVLGYNHKDTGMVYNNLAKTYAAMEDFKKAHKYYSKAKNIYISSFSKNHLYVGTVYSNLGDLYRQFNKNIYAIFMYSKDLKIRLINLGYNNSETQEVITKLKDSYVSLIKFGNIVQKIIDKKIKKWKVEL